MEVGKKDEVSVVVNERKWNESQWEYRTGTIQQEGIKTRRMLEKVEEGTEHDEPSVTTLHSQSESLLQAQHWALQHPTVQSLCLPPSLPTGRHVHL